MAKERNTFLDGMGSVAAGAASGLVGQAIDSVFGITRRNEERQMEQQRKMQEQQLKGAKEMANLNMENSMAIWNRTAAPAEVAKLKEAGLNPALMYGGGGGGGGTVGGSTVAMPTGGTAANPNESRALDMGMAIQGAQLKLINAQTEKTQAETDKTKGVDTAATTQTTAESRSRQVSIDFQNAVNEAVGNISDAEARRAENSLKGINMEKQNLEWETFKREGWQSGSVEDSSNLANKAIKAGLQQTITSLENAKKDGQIKNATMAIEEFKAGLAREGISPDSPWYIKIVGDLLDKVGLSPIKAVKDTVR